MSKSARFLSIPESTIAIVGIRPLAGRFPQRGFTPEAVVHRCLDVGATEPLSFTGASKVTVRPGMRASCRTFLAFSVTATELTKLYLSLTCSTGLLPERSWTSWKASKAYFEPLLLPWMMTFTSAFGVVLAFAIRMGSTYVGARLALRLSSLLRAPAASGAATTSTATSAVTRPRPPLPQSAFDRESPPRFPVPQSALERCSPRGDPPLPLILFLPLLPQDHLCSSQSVQDTDHMEKCGESRTNPLQAVCWEPGKPGPPRSCASAAGEAARPRSPTTSTARTRLTLVFLRWLRFIPLPSAPPSAVRDLDLSSLVKCGCHPGPTHHPLG
jgi:hypothetical protein